MDGGFALAAIDAVAREATLFAAVGFIVGGIDDLAIDLLYLTRARGRRDRLPDSAVPHRPLAIFVPAWDESGVIGPMLRNALAAIEHGDFRIYVGAYGNDPPTIAEVARVAADDDRVRLVIGTRPGPTTKGDNLNQLWSALLRDEAAEGWHADAVVLHDAEDVVDPFGLRLFDGLLGDYAVVQLPVQPLIARGSRWISAHYADEFAETHTRSLIVRQLLGAALPLAGTGCALRRDGLDAVAAARGGQPFDPDSLTEDYELGLTIAAGGGRGRLARALGPDGRLIAVRAFFPATLDAAVRQKARWMTGIALMGWDRLGWGRALHLSEHWMRMRDRRGPLAVLLLLAAYIALVAGTIALIGHAFTDRPIPALPAGMTMLLSINGGLMAWRLGMRAHATAAIYGWREGMRAVPRAIVANVVALLAARRAFVRYLASLFGARLVWDKTAHLFPTDPEAAR